MLSIGLKIIPLASTPPQKMCDAANDYCIRLTGIMSEDLEHV